MTGLRIAVAGAGTIGRAHVERIEASKECELVAIVDPTPAAAQQARAAGVPFYSSLSELLAAQRLDGVILGTPNKAHVPGAMECVAAGVPTLVEKPIADSVEDGSRLVDAAEAAGVPVQVGHHRRHGPLLKAARRVVDDGTLGPLVAVTGTAMFYKPDEYFETAPWRREPGGGAILINMIHEVDDNQLDHFCAVIRGEAEPMPSAREGLETLRVALAIAEAARTGRVVSTERSGAPVPK